MNLQNNPHTRYNPLTGESVLVSPHRTKRPWQGKQEKPQPEQRQEYDPECYLCPGNSRAGGETNPEYTNTFVFTNDFPSLLPDIPKTELHRDIVFQAYSERGICRVICFSPRHDLSLSRMSPEQIGRVVAAWTEEYVNIGGEPFISYVQIFENKGRLMGCSNPHPHGQIWANEHIPYIPALETEKQSAYHAGHGSCLLCDYIRGETERKTRTVLENSSFLGLVPFWAVWPYEMMVLPKRHMSSLDELTPSEGEDLAVLIRRLGIIYDGLFDTELPYSMGIHQRPTDGKKHDPWHLHFHYYPPLLRSATVKKFMVGYEMLGMPQRDITPEQAAERLRGLVLEQ
jgi:UDPglucose--hexose-1-phosphate uridylyltransferase